VAHNFVTEEPTLIVVIVGKFMA